uniref:Uncharacterized protein n=1 Tax=Haptolina ericina TaxID=156174 RepID=A0A7S3BYW8_9EUKA
MDELAGEAQEIDPSTSYGTLIGKYMNNAREVDIDQTSDVEINPVMLYMIQSEKQRTQGIQAVMSTSRARNAARRGGKGVRMSSSGGLNRLGLTLEHDQEANYKVKALKEVESFLAGRAGVDVRVQQSTGTEAGKKGVTSPLKAARPQKAMSHKTADTFRTTRRQQEQAGGLAYVQAQERSTASTMENLSA